MAGAAKSPGKECAMRKKKKSLENCDPNPVSIVVPKARISSSTAAVLHESNKSPLEWCLEPPRIEKEVISFVSVADSSDEAAVIPSQAEDPGTIGKDSLGEEEKEEEEEEEVDRHGGICGTRVQSLVQAFESMISLADAQARIRKISGHRKWQPKVAKADEEFDHSLAGKAQERLENNESEEDVYRDVLDEKDDVQSEKNCGSECGSSEKTCSSECGSSEKNCSSESGSSEKRCFSDYGSSEKRCFSDCGSSEIYTEHQKGLKATSAQPFSLRTQTRGAKKENEFRKKLQKILEEDSKLRIPIAQGLPWTTDEPEVVPKPPPKESTVPLDIRLFTQCRSERRAQFDDYISAKILYIEQQREEQQRLQELAEQEEIKQLRKEMVPRAQLMPYFDRPFIPQRSSKALTVPKEPNFHCTHDHKRAKSCIMSQ